MFCASNGMRLAKFQSSDEFSNLLTIAREKGKYFEEDFYVSDENDSEISCINYKKLFRGGFQTNDVDSSYHLSKFLCEDIQITDNFEALEPIKEVDVKSTFFQAIGSYSNDNSTKAYYLSRTTLTVPEATIACKSFEMELASPKNPEEFINLKSLLADSSEQTEFVSATVAVYRSEVGNTWVDGDGNKVNYGIDWAEPSNWDGDDNCIAFQIAPNLLINSVSCSQANAFICEDNQDDVDNVKAAFDINEVAKFMNINANKSISTSDDNLIYYPSRSWIKLSLFEAKMICESFGMQIYTPVSDFQTSIATGYFATSDYSSFNVGFTSMGTSKSWYSVNNGKVENIDLDLKPTEECLKIDEFGYGTAECTSRHSFICQKSVPTIIEFRNSEYTSYPKYQILDDDDYVS